MIVCRDPRNSLLRRGEMRVRADTFLYGGVAFPFIECLLFYRMSSSLKAVAIYSRDVPTANGARA